MPEGILKECRCQTTGTGLFQRGWHLAVCGSRTGLAVGLLLLSEPAYLGCGWGQTVPPSRETNAVTGKLFNFYRERNVLGGNSPPLPSKN